MGLAALVGARAIKHSRANVLDCAFVSRCAGYWLARLHGLRARFHRFATQSGDRFEIMLGFDGAPEPVSTPLNLLLEYRLI